MKILLVGFEPFAGFAANPSAELVRALAAGSAPPRSVLDHAVLPVSWSRAPVALMRRLERDRPDAVVMFGLARGSSRVAIERIALNLADEATPDEDGEIRRDAELVPGGPLAYRATLPIDAMAAAIRAEGVPCGVSNHAGAFLCNQVFYLTAHRHATGGAPARFGFVHLPHTPAAPPRDPSVQPVSATDLERALGGALRVLAATR